jgi:hypothetical protein
VATDAGTVRAVPDLYPADAAACLVQLAPKPLVTSRSAANIGGSGGGGIAAAR